MHRPIGLIRPRPALLLVLLAACGAGSSSDEAPTAPASGPSDAAGLALIEPDHPAHPGWVDLGNIPLGEIREQSIPLRNLENRPVTIRSIRAGCSCTIPSIRYEDAEGALVTGDPSGPGDVITLPALTEAELVLRVDSRRAPVRNKPKLITIRIVTDSEVEPYLTVEARLFVEAAFRTAPDAIDLGRVPINGGGDGATRVFTADASGRQVAGVASVPDGLEAVVTESYQLGVTAWNLEVRAVPPVKAGYAVHQVLLATTGPEGEGEGEPFAVEVRVNGVPDLEVRPTRLLLRPPGAGELARAEVQLFSHLPGQRMRVLDAELEGPFADELLIELRADHPDDDGRSSTWTVVLSAPRDLGPDPIAGTLTLTLDDPQHPELVVPYLTLGS
jgi:hypothetical protein